MSTFKRYEGYVMNVPQKFIDNNLPVCPFCHTNDPHWLLASKADLMNYRTLYKCEKCGAIMSGNSMDAAAQDGQQFRINPAAAGINAAQKGSKGQTVGVTYMRIDDLGAVCTNAALLGQELPITELQNMAVNAAVAQPAEPQYQVPQQPQYQAQQYQEPVAPQYQAPQQPQYQAPQYQAPQYQAPAAPQYQQPQYQAPAVPQYQAAQQPQYQAAQQPQYPPQQYQAPAGQQYVPVEPQYQRAVNPQQATPARPRLVMSILSAVFGFISFICGFGALEEPEVGTVFAFLFMAAAIPLGVIGLIKSIKSKFIAGIIVAAVGLFFAFWGFILFLAALSEL